MDVRDLRSIFYETSPRPPVPGEVWKFDALEVHAISMSLDAIKHFMDEKDAESLMINIFDATNKEYELNKVRGEISHGLIVVPTPEDRGFFAALIATTRWHLWCLPTEVEIEENSVRKKVRLELPCGHEPTEHETILRSWYDREIVQAKRFAASRRAVESLPTEERFMGKPIIARSDLEREVKDRVQSDLNRGLYSQKLTEELIESIVRHTGQARERAEAIVARMREVREREMTQELTELSETTYRVIEGF